MTLRTVLSALGAVVILLIVALGVRYAIMGGSPANVTASGAPTVGGPFTLVDHTGKTVTDADFRGQFMLVYFGYTFCPDVCPTSLQAMTTALESLPPEQAAKVTPILVTIDPARDTPAVLKSYIVNFHPRTVGLTGSEEQVRAAGKAYRAYSAKVSRPDTADYLMDHSSIIYLMGPDGRFLAHFGHGVPPEQIAEGLKKHL